MNLKLVEVSARDGFQSQSVVLAVSRRAEYLAGFIQAGHRHLEVGSYVDEKVLPQVSQCGELLLRLRDLVDLKGIETIALCFNPHGLEKALDDGVQTVGLVLGCSDLFNLKNIRKNKKECFELYQGMRDQLRKTDKTCRFYLSTLTECSYEGRVSRNVLFETVERIIKEIAPDELILSDTLGALEPGEVSDIITFVEGIYPLENVGFHFHDPYGRALLLMDRAIQKRSEDFRHGCGRLRGVSCCCTCGGEFS